MMRFNSHGQCNSKRLFSMAHRSFIAVLLLVGACGGDTGSSPVENPLFTDEEYNAVIRQAGTAVISPAYQRFSTNTEKLSQAIDSYCQAVAVQENVATSLNAAQVAWSDSMADWQYLEAFQVGPITEQAATPRNMIYSWPLTSPCGVDREVASQVTTLPTSLNRIGMDAISYLLFDEDLNHACTDSVTETQGFNDLTDQAKQQRRCSYLKLLVADVSERAQQLAQAWNPEEGAYTEAWIADTSQSASAKANVLSDALVAYMDQNVKGLKLAIPTGIASICSKSSCPESVEHPFSKTSLESIAANIKGFRDVFQGSQTQKEDDSFSGLLVQQDGSSLSERILASVEHVLAKISDTGKTLTELTQAIDQAACQASTSESRLVEACAIHADVKVITDDLRGDFLDILNLKTPQQVSGDND